MPWPVLNHYEGDALRQVAFPLGGIGTGTISLGGRAELRDFEIFNTPAKGSNPPFTFFASLVPASRRPACHAHSRGGAAAALRRRFRRNHAAGRAASPTPCLFGRLLPVRTLHAY